MMDEGGELAERIEGGEALMISARNPRMVGDCELGKASVEGEVLWVVMTNAVEVEIGDLGGGIGVAVYGPWFSWFNHSCAPNACYRFELLSGIRGNELRPSKVLPAGGDGEALDMWKMWWDYTDNGLADGLNWFGPRIIIRSIKPLSKDDEVCITYTDILHPKALRHFDLWSRYRFVCYCERCCMSPQMYIDYILSCNVKSPDSENNEFDESELLEVSGYLETTLAEYMSSGNPDECCQKLGNMLSDGFHNKLSEAFESRFRLHPLHFVSLKAYIALSSAYRIQANNFYYTDLRIGEAANSFKMARSSAACSLLVAGASLHLFMSDTSIILNTALSWIDAGESFLYLLRIATYLRKFLEPGFSLAFASSHFTIVEDECKSTEDLLVVSAHFMDRDRKSVV